MELTLLFAALTGVAFAWLATRLFGTGVEHPLDHLVSPAAVGMLAGRAGRMVADGVNPLLHPADLLILRAGISTPVSAAAAVLTLVWLLRRRLPDALDQLAPIALAGLVGWEAGCLWRGTCLGTVSSLPWAWAQPGSDVARHPVGLYAAALLLVAAFLVARLRDRPLVATGTALAAAAGSRLLTAPLRPLIGEPPRLWYLSGLVLGIALVVAALVRSSRPPLLASRKR